MRNVNLSFENVTVRGERVFGLAGCKVKDWRGGLLSKSIAISDL